MSLIHFAEFVADARTGELKRDGRRVRLPPQSFQILLALVRTPGELVTRESLQAELWPATSQVEWEQGLNAAVNRLREALGDSAAEPKYIETLPRRGYRFIGKLEPAPAAASAAETPANHENLHPAPSSLTTGRRRGRLLAALLGGFGVLLMVAWLLPKPDGPILQPRQLKPFTSLPGEERGPAFAPDGTRIAFAWNGENDSGFDLYVKAMDSEQLLRLTRTPALALSGAWSPDGASLAFTRRTPQGSGVFIVPAMGGAERRVAAGAFMNDAFMQLAWAADGKHLAYATFDGSGAQRVHLLDVATLESVALPMPGDCWNSGLPAFSADGEQLAFICTTSVGVFVVHVMQLDTRKARAIAGLLGEPQGLTWGADRGSLILASDSGEGGALWRLGLDGNLSRYPFGEEGSAPTRAGTRIAYVRSRAPVDIWRMDLAAPDPEASARRFIYSTRRDSTPQYTPDGSHIVFQSNRSGSAEIWMANAEGAEAVRLTQFNGPLAGAPTVCNDGKRVALDARVGGTPALFIVDADERQPRKVPSAELALGLPAWSADCFWLLASDGRGKLFRLPAAGGAATRFTQQTSYYAQVTGDRVVFNVKQPFGVNLWSQRIDGGEQLPLPGMPLVGYPEAWTVTASGVFYTAGEQGRSSLWFYDFTTQKTRRLAGLAKPPTPGGGLGIAVSRDGRWLLYTQGGTADSDIMLMEMR